jgi:glycosyltransferase involved in cell wall biosynthesis
LISDKEVFFIETKKPNSIALAVEEVLKNRDISAKKVEAVYYKATGFTVEKCAERVFDKLGFNRSVFNE